MNVVDEIKAIVEHECSSPYRDGESARIDQAIAARLGDSSGDILERRYQEYAIQNGGDGLCSLANQLDWMRSLGISAAPEKVVLISMREGYVLISRYWACPGEALLPAKPEHVRFGEAARKRFRRDMEVLADHGKRHPYASRGFAHWFVGASSGTIVMNAWSNLTACTPRDRVHLFDDLDELLAKRSDPL